MGSRSRSRTWRWSIAIWFAVLAALLPHRAGAQRRAEALAGLRFGPPLRAGLAAGVAYGGSAAAGEFAGVLGVVEVAVGGGRASAGYLWAGPFASGISMLGSVLYTWGSPSQVEARRTLAGGEVRLMFFTLNVGAGVFRPIGGGGRDRDARYFLNIGLGV